MSDGFERYAIVALGSAVGGCARYALGGWISDRAGATFPWGTFVVNVTGCFVLGFFMTAALERLDIDPRWRLLVAVGVCGGYTTFSAFAYETSKLVAGRDYLFAGANVVSSAFAGLAAVWCGTALARWLW
jgi:CrcB protein